MTFISNFWQLFVISAPWLMLGLLLAGLLNVFIPKDFLQRHLGKEGLWTTIKAALIGAPMPLCSCGVIPAAIGLRRAGGSKSATTAFLVSTPETGVDSISVSYALLGPFMAIIRPIAAVTSAITAGVLVGRDAQDGQDEAGKEASESPSANQSSCCAKASQVAASSCASQPKNLDEDDNKASCCAEEPQVAASSCATQPKSLGEDVNKTSCCAKEPQVAAFSCATQPKSLGEDVNKTSCCAKELQVAASSCATQPESLDESENNASCCSKEPVVAPKLEREPVSCCASENKKFEPEVSTCCSSKAKRENSLLSQLWQAVKFSCNKLLSDTMVWLLIGIFFAALVQTFVPTAFLAQWGDGILAMIVVILISIPMYICATASTPIAAGLLLAGVSPGAVLVFMLAGPATNVATIGVVAKELGRRAVVAYITAVIGVAIVFGFLTDYLVSHFGFEVSAMAGHEHQLLPSWMSQLMALVLVMLMLRLFAIDVMKRRAA
ncbi:SO_0444 family Cu/Zn efflux transporter [Pseudoalteromonas luteoviolacea]|uniref:SO_0444 family Cu/Zn efflux transporter n=1 Tax=Pseudoalteromonas luteoviolacea TaxID=43657 RepID=UPI001F1A845D|nr:SO_0444 family Cu/Zn efflux transporter [Pseudoalteromonas luteoviolacea]MCF6441689.1 SO_0444 family Cu/Zn efflux transporter [Pseudoalteromonas luteoviolacea]